MSGEMTESETLCMLMFVVCFMLCALWMNVDAVVLYCVVLCRANFLRRVVFNSVPEFVVFLALRNFVDWLASGSLWLIYLEYLVL